jgi:hypothetical protein
MDVETPVIGGGRANVDVVLDGRRDPVIGGGRANVDEFKGDRL